MFPTEDQQKSLCLSLLWDLCAGVNTECFILKGNQMPFVILAPDIEILRICSGAGTERIRSAADLVGIDTLTKVKRICSAGVTETHPVEIGGEKKFALFSFPAGWQWVTSSRTLSGGGQQTAQERLKAEKF